MQPYEVGNASGLVKLVLLQSNLLFQNLKKVQPWVYVPKDDLEKVIKEGHGDVYGVNKIPIVPYTI